MEDTSEFDNGTSGPGVAMQGDTFIYNVTRQSNVYAKFCAAYVIPLVLIVTIITNTLVVMVLAQKHMRTPTNIVLFTMAIVDLLTLLSPSPWYFYIFTLGYDKLLYSSIACKTHYIMTDVIPVLFHTSSIWLALLLASQRYIYVCHPTLASTWCTVPRVRKAIIVIIIVAFAHQITKFFDKVFVQIKTDSKQDACRLGTAGWVEYLGEDTYHMTYFTFRIAFVFIIPIFSLITLNFLLFRALRRADDKRTRLLKSKFKSIGARSSIGNVETIKHPSFTHNNNGCLTTDVGTSQGSASHFSKSIGRKSPNSAVEHQFDPMGRSGSENQQTDLEARDRSMERKQRGMFSIGSLQLKRKHRSINKTNTDRAANQQQLGSSSTNMLRCSSTNNQTNDPKLSGSGCNDHQFITSERACISTTSGGFSLKSRLSRARQFMQGGNRDSNDCCSITTNQSNRERNQNGNNCGHVEIHQRPSSAMTSSMTTNKSKLFIVSPNKSCGQNNCDEISADDNGNSLTCKEGEEDEFPSCVDCATCQKNFESECRHCSAAAANEGATVGAGHHSLNSHAQNFNRTVSQCSSLLGVATNTTTNEDGSSCIVTQNASSSMFVAHCDGTLDATEVTSMKEEEETYHDVGGDNEENGVYADHEDEEGGGGGDDDDKIANSSRADNEESRLLNRRRQSAAKPLIGTRMSIPLAKSGSIDSRLVCGCLSPSPTGEAPAGKAVLCRGSSRLGSVSTRLKHGCRQCCLANNCSRAHTDGTSAIKQTTKSVGGGGAGTTSFGGAKRNTQDYSKATKCAAFTCSISEPCINCNNSSLQGRLRASKNIGRANIDDDNDEDDDDENGQSRRVGSSNDDRNQCRRHTRMPTSQSDYGNGEGGREEVKSIADGNQITTTNTTTTTTTTLYSNNATSIGSLAQIQPGTSCCKTMAVTALSNDATNIAATATNRQNSQVSPSFANSTCRGSKATLVSSSATNPTSGQLPMHPPTLISDSGGSGGGTFVAANTSASVRTMDSNRTTLMLIVVVTVFLIIEVPTATATILHVLRNWRVEWFINYDLQWIYNVSLFSDFLMTISSPINFTIYCSMSKKFRETFRELLLGNRARHKRSHRLIYQQPQISQCPQAQVNFNQDNQITAVAGQALKSNNSNNSSTNVGIVQHHNEFTTTTVSGPNHNAATAGVMKYSPYRRANSQQQECEL